MSAVNCHKFNNEKIAHIKSLIDSDDASAEDGGNFRKYYDQCSIGLPLGDIHNIMNYASGKNFNITQWFIDTYAPPFDVIFTIIQRSLHEKNPEFAGKFINTNIEKFTELNIIELSTYFVQNANDSVSLHVLGYSANKFTKITSLPTSQEVIKELKGKDIPYHQFSLEVLTKLASFDKQHLQKEFEHNPSLFSCSLLVVLTNFHIEEKNDEISKYLTTLLSTFDCESKTIKDQLEAKILPNILINSLITVSLYHQHNTFASHLIDEFDLPCSTETLDTLNYSHDNNHTDVFKKLTTKLFFCSNEEKLRLILKEINLNGIKEREHVIKELIKDTKVSVTTAQKNKILEFAEDKVNPEFIDTLEDMFAINTPPHDIL